MVELRRADGALLATAARIDPEWLGRQDARVIVIPSTSSSFLSKPVDGAVGLRARRLSLALHGALRRP